MTNQVRIANDRQVIARLAMDDQFRKEVLLSLENSQSIETVLQRYGYSNGVAKGLMAQKEIIQQLGSFKTSELDQSYFREFDADGNW